MTTINEMRRIGVPAAFTTSAVAIARAPDRVFAIIALVVSSVELPGLVGLVFLALPFG